MTVRVAYTWRCLTCDEHGAGPRADKDAEKHTRTTEHSTTTSGRPATTARR